MREINCTYKDESYSVRESGEILRYSRVGKRPRPTDNQWTFGKANDKTGYMEITTGRVHRIVATAFHGVAPTEQHVVDHIDTNRRNNRPENLRWVTKLENILLNPITAKRIAIACGSVEAFLAEPSKFRDAFLEPNYKWMSSVSPEEAQVSLERLLAWAKNEKSPSSDTLGEWIFKRTLSQITRYIETTSEESGTIKAITKNARQVNWNTPSEFPCCPQEQNYIKNPLEDYADNLKTGSIFCQNNIYTSLVLKNAISNNGQSLYVISESKNSIKPWALAEITYKNDVFLHSSLGTFFTQEGIEKQYCLAQGIEWLGGDSVDDYC